jgi:phospholipid-binding lipoprotein MlaA
MTGGDGKSVTDLNDDLNDYNVVSIADPLQPLNRATFWLNDQVYSFVVRPVSKTYDTVVPKPVRTGVYNVFDNIDFPIRFVNDALQGNFRRAGQETGKFLVNTTIGVAGIMRQSDRFPSLANVPAADTGQTFAKWGIDHGIYIVLPILGPSSLRDTVGKAGDYALNPVTWFTLYVPYAWTLGVSVPDSVRTFHGKLSEYDAATSNALDRYLAVRSAYIQNRQKKASQ